MPYATHIDNSQEIKIHYEVDGAPNNPILLMVHGTGNSIKDWYGLGYIDVLKKYFRVVMYDVRGHGESDKPHLASQYNPELLAADCLAVMDKLNIEKCHFFGTSKGGTLGFHLAKYHPERFISFVLVGAEPYGSSQAYGFVSLLQESKVKGREYFVKQLEAGLGKAFPVAIRENFKTNDFDALIAFCELVWPDNSDAFKKIDVPGCLFVGGNKELEPFYEQMTKFSRENPKCEFHILAGMSHVDTFWKGDVIAPLIIGFCRNIDSKAN